VYKNIGQACTTAFANKKTLDCIQISGFTCKPVSSVTVSLGPGDVDTITCDLSANATEGKSTRISKGVSRFW